METVTVYKTEDGMSFDTETAAAAHEEVLGLAKEVAEYAASIDGISEKHKNTVTKYVLGYLEWKAAQVD